jgi:RNA polymerase sigma factor (sigma-70 family)
MSDIQEKKLLNEIKSKNSGKALEELMLSYEKMFYSIGRRILGSHPLEFQDFVDSRLALLFEAAKSFDKTKKVKFSTWLFNCIRYKCLNTAKNLGKKADLSDEDLKLILDLKSCTDKSLNNEDNFSLNALQDLLEAFSDKKSKEVIKLRYFSEQDKVLNYVEIGKILKVTPQTALNWHNKFINFAKKKLTRTQKKPKIHFNTYGK